MKTDFKPTDAQLKDWDDLYFRIYGDNHEDIKAVFDAIVEAIPEPTPAPDPRIKRLIKAARSIKSFWAERGGRSDIHPRGQELWDAISAFDLETKWIAVSIKDGSTKEIWTKANEVIEDGYVCVKTEETR